jgi:hypothetical protein
MESQRIEELDDGHPAHGLLQERVQPRRLNPDHLVSGAQQPAEEHAQAEEQRHTGEGHEREGDVLDQQDDDDRDDGDQVGEDHHHAPADRVLEAVDVGRQARHEPPDGVAMEEAQPQPVDVPEQRRAQVGQRAQPHPLQQVELARLGREAHHDGAEIGQGQQAQATQLAGPHVLVDGDLQQVRLYQ